MATSVLCVGTELLLGQIEDTNSGYIGRVLADHGITSLEQRKVGDNFERLKNTIVSMLQIADSIIICGGLGPTHDDITREVVAEIMGVESKIDDEVEKNMRDIFSRRDLEMPIINLRQAMVPEGAMPIANIKGTAPGLICPLVLDGKNKSLYLVPGFPHELKPMLHNVIIPNILGDENIHDILITRTLKSWGISESSLSETLNSIIEECENGIVKIGFLARGINGIYIKISAKSDSESIAMAEIARVEQQVMDLVSDCVYAYDDETMESKIVELLSKCDSTLSIAESFTGGLVASRIVEVPGASNVLVGGQVLYSDEIKKSLLGIDFDDVYSKDCAEKMAKATLEIFDTDFAIATTGVAGPDTVVVNGLEHVRGECYFAIASKDRVEVVKMHLGGDRQRVREYGTITVLNLLQKFILDGNISV